MSGENRVRGLDGLRAVGCALVLVYHLWPAWAPGGNIGVDVFFVVSGFLITTLLAREITRTGSVDVAAFIVRRLRRLAPAVVTCALVVTAMAAWVGGDVLVRIGRQLLGTLTFTANWFQVADGQSYFDQQTPSLLTHAWSLGVEQQFYLLWPPVLLLIWLAPRTVRPWLALALGAGSVALAALLGGSRAYLGTDTHLYGLMVGAALALALLPARPRRSGGLWYPSDPGVRGPGRVGPVQGVLRGGLAWAAVVGLVPLAVLGDASAAWATPWLLLGASVLTVAVVQALTPAVLAHAPGRVLAGVLELRPIVWAGERSYSIYLWHWPLLVLADARWPYADRRLIAVGVLAATLLAAEASFRWVETPVRRHGLRGVMTLLRRRSIAVGAPVVVATSVVLAGTALAVERAPARTEVEELFAQGPGEGGVHTYPAPGDGGEDAGESPGGGADEGPGEGGEGPGESPSGSAGEGPDESPSGGAGDGTSGAPSGAPDDPAPSSVDGADLSVVGDSVTLASGPSLGERFPGVTVDAEVSRSFVAVLGIAEQMAADGSLRGHVVVAGATNSDISDGQVDALAEVAGGRCVVLVTGYGPGSATWIGGANEAIRAGAERHENVVVADWHAVASADPTLLAEDHIHPVGEGAARYAQVVDEALATCP